MRHQPPGRSLALPSLRPHQPNTFRRPPSHRRPQPSDRVDPRPAARPPPARGCRLPFPQGYSLPGYYAFKSYDEPHPALMVAATMMFVWGSLINCAADFYKDGSKSAKPGAVVAGGPFRLARHINWCAVAGVLQAARRSRGSKRPHAGRRTSPSNNETPYPHAHRHASNPLTPHSRTPGFQNRFGDWLRYGSFTIVSGGAAPAAYFPLAWTVLVNLGSLKERDAGQAKRGGEAFVAATPAIVPWRLLF